MHIPLVLRDNSNNSKSTSNIVLTEEIKTEKHTYRKIKALNKHKQCMHDTTVES
jgi:hypothetical protein